MSFTRPKHFVSNHTIYVQHTLDNSALKKLQLLLICQNVSDNEVITWVFPVK